MSDQIPEIKEFELAKLELKPGDLLIIKYLNRHPTHTEMKHLKDSLMAILPKGVDTFFYFSQDVELSLLGPEFSIAPQDLDEMRRFFISLEEIVRLENNSRNVVSWIVSHYPVKVGIHWRSLIRGYEKMRNKLLNLGVDLTS